MQYRSIITLLYLVIINDFKGYKMNEIKKIKSNVIRGKHEINLKKNGYGLISDNDDESQANEKDENEDVENENENENSNEENENENENSNEENENENENSNEENEENENSNEENEENENENSNEENENENENSNEENEENENENSNEENENDDEEKENEELIENEDNDDKIDSLIKDQEINMEFTGNMECKIELNAAIRDQFKDEKLPKKLNITFRNFDKSVCELVITRSADFPELKTISVIESDKKIDLIIKEMKIEHIFESMMIYHESKVEKLSIELDLSISRETLYIQGYPSSKYTNTLSNSETHINTKSFLQDIDTNKVNIIIGLNTQIPANYFYSFKKNVENFAVSMSTNKWNSENKINIETCDITDMYSKYSKYFTVLEDKRLCDSTDQSATEKLTCSKGMTLATDSEIDANKQNKCIPCEKGFFKNITGNSKCYKCPLHSNTEFKGSISIKSCKCLAGYFLENEKCIPCPLGFFKTEIGNWSCTDCGPFLSTFSTAMFTQDGCGCKEGYEMVSGQCISCPLGTYKDFVSNYIRCIKCGPDSTTYTLGTKSKDDCVCKKGKEMKDGVCKPCDIGFFKPNEFLPKCIPCVENSTSLDKGSDNILNCKCIEGYMPDYSTSSFKCIPVPKGYFKDSIGNSLPKRCPNNMTTVIDKSKSISDCKCGPGYEVKDILSESDKIRPLESNESMNMFCHVCPLGSYKLHAGPEKCELCPKNMTTDSRGTSSYEKCRCKAGYEEIISNDERECLKKSTNDEDHDPKDDESNEDKVKYMKLKCKAGMEVWDGKCRPCQLGYYNENDESNRCTPCDENKTTLNIGSTSKSNCLCVYGYENYDSEDFDSHCVAVPQGFYKNSIGSPGKVPCPSNMTTLNEGSISVDQCQCLFGFEKTPFIIESKCRPCQKGYFRESHQYSVCIACPHNTSTKDVGSKSHDDCQCNDGYYIMPGSDECAETKIGYFKNDVSNNEYKSCPEFMTTQSMGSVMLESCQCIAGYEYLGDQCIPCDVGFYKDEVGNGLCQPCGWQMGTAGKIGSFDKDIHCKVECNARYYVKQGVANVEVCVLRNHLIGIIFVSIFAALFWISSIIYILKRRRSTMKRKEKRFQAFLDQNRMVLEGSNQAGVALNEVDDLPLYPDNELNT